MKHLYKKLHTNDLVDINLLVQVFAHNDVYMRDVIIGQQSGVSEPDMLRVQQVVMDLCQKQDQQEKDEKERLRKEKKEKKKDLKKDKKNKKEKKKQIKSKS